jgi:hypothetical protein
VNAGFGKVKCRFSCWSSLPFVVHGNVCQHLTESFKCQTMIFCVHLFCATIRGVMLLIIFLLQHPEFSFLLKERVCALVIKLFSPNIKYRSSVPASVQQATPLDKPYFPISMRLLRVVSILIQQYHSLLVRHSWSFVRHSAGNMKLRELR